MKVMPFGILIVLVSLVLVESEPITATIPERVLRGRSSAAASKRNLVCNSPQTLLESGDSLSAGEEVFTLDGYASVKQEPTGNLVIKRISDGHVLCQSGFYAPSIDKPYFTTLIGDGNLITWESPDRIPPGVWKSDAIGPTSSNYFLAVDCDDTVSIYERAISNRTSILWTCPNSEETALYPTQAPSPEPAPRPKDAITTFCVVADAPYKHSESIKLLEQVDNMDPECEFVAHLGDIRSARLSDTCVQETYTNASLIMKRSNKPVLMMLGGK